MTESRIDTMLDSFVEQGMGGVFIHPRPGLITNYLSDRWFALWRYALEGCQQRGLQCHIYDENSFPSGFAGGHVLAQYPELRGHHLVKEDATYAIRPLPATAWTAGHGSVDRLHPDSARRFIELTHERYRTNFESAFGKTIGYVFTDEPSVCDHCLAMSDHLLESFEAQHGYRLESHFATLIEATDNPDDSRIRFDYWSTVDRLFLKNFLRPIRDWCSAHGLQFTGHFHESAWPAPLHQPSTMAALRCLHVPGNDLLGFQFKPTSLEANAIHYLNLKELESVRRQAGAPDSLVESCGGGGYEMGPLDFKPLEDFCIALGVTRINPHLAHQTIAGSRKYDWPQTISDHTAWSERAGTHNTHVARSIAALSHGSTQAKVLVVHPDSSGWLDPIDPRPRQLSKPHAKIRATHLDLLCRLHRAGIEYDLGDDISLADQGRVTGDGHIQLGACNYSICVLPSSCENLLSGLHELLMSAIGQGVDVWLPSEQPTHWNGAPPDAEQAAQLDKLWARANKVYPNNATLINQLQTLDPPTLRFSGGTPGDLCYRRSQDAAGNTTWFFTNPFAATIRTTMHLAQPGWSEFCTATGDNIAYHPGQTVPLDLACGEHLLLHHNPQSRGRAPTVCKASAEPITLQLESIQATEPNTLTIDYCDWSDHNAEHAKNIATIHADHLNWQAHGHAQNPWDRSIQFKDTTIQRAYPKDSGFTCRYHFIISDPFDALEAIIERAELYHVAVNGQPIHSTGAPTWLDENMRRIPISRALRPGHNVLEIDRHPHHSLAEIAPLTLVGDFSAMPNEKGFTLSPSRPLKLGSLQAQGRPFYAGSVDYTFTFKLKSAACGITITADIAESPLAHMAIDDTPIGCLNRQGVLSCPIDLGAGSHTLRLRVYGSLKNQLGPHFSDGLPGAWSWSDCPEAMPPGERYRFHSTGLQAMPILTAAT